jgi:hypothetical protein
VPEHTRPRSSAAKAALSETIEHKLEKHLAVSVVKISIRTQMPRGE